MNTALTPEGTLNALTKAGVADTNPSEVAALVAEGMPPGILVRVVKDALRRNPDISAGEISALLASLEAASVSEEEKGWGQAANEVTGQGESKHLEREENQDKSKNEERENEKNNNGKANGKKE